ncbi:TadE/TadG family type IV pilus assembly protein [Fontimonas sp. SYSU GA230001]|uniref:TadE/TadG family type IV pilus assembly protein n=1 Tax=Fontimonas sp. SYSU GA230001 TaxID=3142450 RepID=UPI0032B31097
MNTSLQCRTMRRQGGSVVVEAAIVLPLLLLLVLATAEFGRALLHYNTLQKTVRDATRYVAENAINRNTKLIDLTPTLIATTRNLAAYGSPSAGTALLPGLAPANVTVTSPDAFHVRVSATYTYRPIFATIPTFGLGSGNISVPTTLTSAQTMRAL